MHDKSLLTQRGCPVSHINGGQRRNVLCLCHLALFTKEIGTRKWVKKFGPYKAGEVFLNLVNLGGILKYIVQYLTAHGTCVCVHHIFRAL